MTNVLTHCTPNIVGAPTEGAPTNQNASFVTYPKAINMLVPRSKAGGPSMLALRFR